MQNSIGEGGDDLFFDANDSLRHLVDSCLSEEFSASSDSPVGRFGYELWASELSSIGERREQFLRSMGFEEVRASQYGQEAKKASRSDVSDDNVDLNRLNECSGAVLDPLSSSDRNESGDSLCCIRDLDSGKKFLIQDLGQEGPSSLLRDVGTGKVISFREFESIIGLSGSLQRFLRREESFCGGKDVSFSARKKKRRKWWRSFTLGGYEMGMCKQDDIVKNSEFPKAVRMKVQSYGKKSSDFSAMYAGQEIQAHKGLIRTMKFSPSGQLLASGGEDCVVRIWRIREVEAACRCSANGYSGSFDEKKMVKLMTKRRSFNSTHIVVPKKLFMIEDTPLHEFLGHTNEVLDLSWAKSEFLLTSSKDRTVRMWKVGCTECLKVFPHNDYVTSIQFNPVDENHFISGSIDGKVRIWGISENRVVDWVDVRDIVTAVCFAPNGEGFLVGCITGNCRFYDYSGKNLQLGAHFCVQGKKKPYGKPITGLQFSPGDAEKVLVVSADCKVRIHKGVDVVCKFKGVWKSKRQLSAAFTSDGRYIISVGEDSHVYMWNYNEASTPPSHRGVKSTRSCEHFFSEGVLLAIPWPGLDHRGSPALHNGGKVASCWKTLESSTWVKDSDCSLGVWFLTDTSLRASATWPEEELPSSTEQVLSVEGGMVHESKSRYLPHHYRCLASLASTWGLAFVTASKDGFIRSYQNYGLPVRL